MWLNLNQSESAMMGLTRSSNLHVIPQIWRRTGGVRPDRWSVPLPGQVMTPDDIFHSCLTEKPTRDTNNDTEGGGGGMLLWLNYDLVPRTVSSPGFKLPVQVRGQRAVSRRINGQERAAVALTESKRLLFLTKTSPRLSLATENGGYWEKTGR